VPECRRLQISKAHRCKSSLPQAEPSEHRV
jgi:hypothetical protein